MIIRFQDVLFDQYTLGELKSQAKVFYKKNLKGRSVINRHKGITIIFNEKGLRHTLYARKIGFTKIKAIWYLDEMVQEAVYCNFKNPDYDDVNSVLGYLNFKIRINSEGVIFMFRLVIRLTKDGKFYYDHAVKAKNKV